MKTELLRCIGYCMALGANNVNILCGDLDFEAFSRFIVTLFEFEDSFYMTLIKDLNIQTMTLLRRA